MIIEGANRLNQIQTYYFARKLAQIREMNADSGLQVINLGIGSPDLAPSDKVIEVLQKLNFEN